MVPSNWLTGVAYRLTMFQNCRWTFIIQPDEVISNGYSLRTSSRIFGGKCVIVMTHGVAYVGFVCLFGLFE